MGTGTDVSHAHARAHTRTNETTRECRQSPIDTRRGAQQHKVHKNKTGHTHRSARARTHTHTQLYRDSHSDWATFPTGMGSSVEWKTNVTPGGLWIRSTLGISHWDRGLESGRMRMTRGKKKVKDESRRKMCFREKQCLNKKPLIQLGLKANVDKGVKFM